MISHALTIIKNELHTHLDSVYGSTNAAVELRNLAEGIATGPSRETLNLSVINIKEEKALKNLSNYVRNDITQKVNYENQPTFLNFQILLTATHANYTNALSLLSRAIRFFQFKNVFTQDSVAPNSIITTDILINDLDKLETFKLIFDLYSPSMEEVNHLWGTLGGKQYPFVMYTMRMLDLKFKATQSESKLITEIRSDFYHTKTGVN